jgi:hypothetical protein
LNRAAALKIVNEIWQHVNGNIDGISLHKITSDEEYSILLKVSPQYLPKDVIQPILDKYNLTMKEETSFIYIKHSMD